jgi:hypothetical protein
LQFLANFLARHFVASFKMRGRAVLLKCSLKCSFEQTGCHHRKNARHEEGTALC